MKVENVKKINFNLYYLHLIARILTICFHSLLYSLVRKLLHVVRNMGCVTYTMLSPAHIFFHSQSNTIQSK